MFNISTVRHGWGVPPSGACGRTRDSVVALAFGMWLGSAAFAFALHAQAVAPEDARPSTHTAGTLHDSDPEHRVQIPLSAHLYTSQVQLGSVQWVMHPGIALGVEYPRWRFGKFSVFPTWKLGFEHHARLHQRWYAGLAPTLRAELHPAVALQLSAGASGARLRSLWTPYHFDSSEGTWSRGESEGKWTWLFDVALTAWFNISQQLGVGLDYGLGVLYPFASANDVPLVPLTRLGLRGRWVYEI